MIKKMLVESTPHQSRVAVLEDERLTELFVERVRERGLVGNVFKGRVTRVLPGMQAAFVNIGLERDAFLYVSDVGEVETDDDLELEGGLDGGLDLETDDGAGATGGGRSATRSAAPQPSIQDLLRPGEELVVQVTKDPMPNKGARITAHISLPGRHLVLLPEVRHRGISRRIEDADERQRLLDLIGELDSPAGGLIVRTVGEGGSREAFETDLAYLTDLWQRIRERAAQVRAPTLIHRELDLVLRTVRDLFSEDFELLWVDGQETYERIVEFLDPMQLDLVARVKLYNRDENLFQTYRIDQEMEAALRSKVWLKSGGYLVIHPTEALVAIDVNTGRFTGGQDLEDTVVKTNLEAIREVVRQIRLRDLGGIIVLDLIDMAEESNRRLVFSALEKELAKDRTKNRVLSISEFGLVELTRKRSRPSLQRMLTQPCPYCQGRGRIRSLATICLALRRDALDRRITPGGELLLRVHPDVAQALQRDERPILDELHQRLGVEILVQSDPELHHEQYDLSEL